MTFANLKMMVCTIMWMRRPRPTSCPILIALTVYNLRCFRTTTRLSEPGSSCSSAAMSHAQFRMNVDSGFTASNILYFLTWFGVWHAA